MEEALACNFSKSSITHYSMGVFHVFSIVQMVPNHAKHNGFTGDNW